MPLDGYALLRRRLVGRRHALHGFSDDMGNVIDGYLRRFGIHLGWFRPGRRQFPNGDVCQMRDRPGEHMHDEDAFTAVCGGR